MKLLSLLNDIDSPGEPKSLRLNSTALAVFISLAITSANIQAFKKLGSDTNFKLLINIYDYLCMPVSLYESRSRNGGKISRYDKQVFENALAFVHSVATAEEPRKDTNLSLPGGLTNEQYMDFLNTYKYLIKDLMTISCVLLSNLTEVSETYDIGITTPVILYPFVKSDNPTSLIDILLPSNLKTSDEVVTVEDSETKRTYKACNSMFSNRINFVDEGFMVNSYNRLLMSDNSSELERIMLEVINSDELSPYRISFRDIMTALNNPNSKGLRKVVVMYYYLITHNVIVIEEV